MLKRSWMAQWRGFSPAEQQWMIGGSERGHPTYISLDHAEFPLWMVDWSYPIRGHVVSNLISVKIDNWPSDEDVFWNGVLFGGSMGMRVGDFRTRTWRCPNGCPTVVTGTQQTAPTCPQCLARMVEG